MMLSTCRRRRSRHSRMIILRSCQTYTLAMNRCSPRSLIRQVRRQTSLKATLQRHRNILIPSSPWICPILPLPWITQPRVWTNFRQLRQTQMRIQRQCPKIWERSVQTLPNWVRMHLPSVMRSLRSPMQISSMYSLPLLQTLQKRSSP